VCVECAVDLGKGLACRSRCEESARAIIQLVDRNIQLTTSPAKAQLVVPAPVQRSGQSTDYVAAQLTSHIRETRHFRWGAGTFCLLVGAILIVAGLLQQIVVLDIVGACFIAFGVVCFVQAQRSARQPRLPETQTR
jgi:cobalamin biosynthesis protein CobD/CbiB